MFDSLITAITDANNAFSTWVTGTGITSTIGDIQADNSAEAIDALLNLFQNNIDGSGITIIT